MSFGYFNLHEHNANESGLRAWVAKNSIVVKSWTPLKAGTSWVDVAVATDTIIGISCTDKTFDSDNFTVAKAKVLYIPEPESQNTYILPIVGWTVTLADQNSFYDLNSDWAVDWTSESTSTWQVELVNFISATKWEFKVVNK